jgi:hypothetical protein
VKYTVTSDKLAGCERGDTISVDTLKPGTNLAALVAAGHIKAVPAPKTPAKDK